MNNIDRNYMRLALVWLVLGTVFGFWMGATGRLDLLGVHVTMLVPGFLTLAVYGVIYRLWPELKASKLAAAQFWCVAVSLLFMVIGSWHMSAAGSIAIVAPASALGIVAAILLAVIFWRETKPA
jgi:hypothetical protein